MPPPTEFPGYSYKSTPWLAKYKGWLTKEVQEALDDPRPNVPYELMAAEWKIERAALAKQIKSAGH